MNSNAAKLENLSPGYHQKSSLMEEFEGEFNIKLFRKLIELTKLNIKRNYAIIGTQRLHPIAKRDQAAERRQRPFERRE